MQQPQTGTGTTTTSHTPSAPPTLRLGSSSNRKKETENDPIVSDFSRPVSSGAKFSSSSSQQVKSRYILDKVMKLFLFIQMLVFSRHIRQTNESFNPQR